MRKLPKRLDPLELWKLWEAGTDPDDICLILRISHCRLRQLAKRFNLRRHEKLTRLLRGSADVDPTEAEIAERAAKIRAAWWTPAETERRQFGFRQARTLAFKLGRDLTLTALDT